jgi:DNA-binding NtrC family response regulator
MAARILVVDDEEGIRFTLEVFLDDEGYEVTTARDYDEAAEIFDSSKFDLVFTDILLGGCSGIELLQTIKKIASNIPVVMITGAPDVETAAEAVRLGAFDYIPKPIKQEALLRVARMALQQKELFDQKEQYRLNLEAIFRSVKDAIVMVDDCFRIVEFNEAAMKICALSVDYVGEKFESVSNCCGTGCLQALEQTLRSRKTTEVPRIVCISGEQQRVLNLTIAPLVSDGNRMPGAVLVIRDETRLDDLERDLGERKQFHKIVGQSAKIQGIYSLIECLADVNTTVLITGESGTGKELVAEAIHYAGDRRAKPLVRVNCAALSEHLLESELFGHVRGAFTGAIKDKTGRFQKADGGTIFLDEIGDLPPSMQVRLLRVLQERKIEKVGDSTPIPIDVRVVAATNQDLESKIRRGEFRQDLFYRLKVVGIPLPPLRERKEDIPHLVQTFIRKFNDKFGKSVRSITDEVLDLFMDFDWPGNIRELEHVLEHAFVLCRDPFISKDHLPPEFKMSASSPPPDLPSGHQRDEERAITEALMKTDGNKAKAARLLNISRRTLYRKIDALGLCHKMYPD